MGFLASTLPAQKTKSLSRDIDRIAESIHPKVIEWRRDIHANPELGNREFRTAEIVADHLRSLGMEVRTEVAHTGVVGILRGNKDSPVVALRADMDALPITELTDVPFASKVRTTYNGQEVGVMHACGHDVHTTVLMGAAEVLAGLKDRLNGTVLFLFQPAEEGAPRGERGGADLMIEEGALDDPRPQAIFGLHVGPLPVGTVATRPGGILASSDGLYIKVKGKQTHASAPWTGVDPIVVASQIVLGMQTVVSRQIDLTTAPAVVSFGKIQGGVRGNIIPEEVELSGTIRSLDPDMRKIIHEKVKITAENIAESAGATAEVRTFYGYPVTMNDEKLTERMIPVLRQVLGEDHVLVMPANTGSEDFSYYARKVPGMFFFLGVAPLDQDPPRNSMPHSPYFFADEGSLLVGMRAMANLAISFLDLPGL